MTIEDYEAATILLADIEKLNEELIRLQAGINVIGQAQVLNAFFDIPALQASGDAAIVAVIDAKQAEFDNL